MRFTPVLTANAFDEVTLYPVCVLASMCRQDAKVIQNVTDFLNTIIK